MTPTSHANSGLENLDLQEALILLSAIFQNYLVSNFLLGTLMIAEE